MDITVVAAVFSKRLRALTILAIAALATAQAAPQILAQSNTRVLQFPARSVGDLEIISGSSYGMIVADGRSRRTAAGRIACPANQSLMLNFNLYGVQNIGFLRRFKPDDLGGLDFSNGVRGFEDLDDLSVESFVGLTGLKSLKIETSEVGDRGLARICDNLKELRSLNIGGTAVTAGGITPLAKLKKLEYFYCARTPFDDRLLEAMKGMTSMIQINASNTQITPAGLKNLAGMKHLQILTFKRCNLGDKGIRELPPLPALTNLSLYGSNMSDESFAVIAAKYPKLSHLDAGYFRKTGHDNLHYLAKLKNLTDLNLSGEMRTPRELSVLTGLTKLQRLVIAGGEKEAKPIRALFPRASIIAEPIATKQNPDHLNPELFAPLR